MNSQEEVLPSISFMIKKKKKIKNKISVPPYLILEALLKSLKIWLTVFKMASEAKGLSFLHLFQHIDSMTTVVTQTVLGFFFPIRKTGGTELATFLTGPGKTSLVQERLGENFVPVMVVAMLLQPSLKCLLILTTVNLYQKVFYLVINNQ